MFNKNKNKEKNFAKINKYKEAIKVINFFMATYDWEKAAKSIQEIKDKETNSYFYLINKLEDNKDRDDIYTQKEIKKQKAIFEKKIKELNSLEFKLAEDKRKYQEKIERERFKVRFKSIKSELNKLIRTNKSVEAQNLLSGFLEENKDKKIVIDFYNKEKKLVQKSKEKEKRKEKEKLKQNAKLEALRLIGINVDDIEDKNTEKVDEEIKEKKPFKERIKEKFHFYKVIKEKLRKKKLIDEISLLIEEDSKIKNDLASQKLANVHKGLVKEIVQEKILGYDFYGKILGADKISGDAFGFYEDKERYNFFIGDATGHGIRAGFIVTLLSRLFTQFIEKKDFKEAVFEINNGLKQDLKNRNFITGIFFEIYKKEISKINYVGMGHEPMLLYKAKDNSIEKIIPGGLAAGIRLIKDKENIKIKHIDLETNDILLSFSDGIIEAKGIEGDFFGLERLKDSFKEYAKDGNIKSIYDNIISDLKRFKGGTNFNDDVTMLLVKRNTNKDVIDENSEYLKELTMKGKINTKDIKKIKGKTKDEIKEELDKITKDKKLKNIIKNLEALYYTGETLKLKQEAIRFIKEGFIDKKINFYLKKAIDNEEKYKIKQKQDRISNKYNVLKELLKKEDYSTVIKETEDIISKDGNI